MDVNELIKKSLDDIDSLVENISNEDTISKAQDDENLSSGDVSEDAPTAEEDTPEAEDGAGDDVDSSNEDVDSDTEGQEDADEEEEEVEKSLEEELKSNEGVRKALEVSEFLDTMVKSISNHLSENVKGISQHNEQLTKSLESQNATQEIIAKSLMGMLKGQQAIVTVNAQLQKQNASLEKSLKVLSKRLESLEAQPQVRKSISNVQAINKSFEASAGVTETKQEQTLSKSQISSKLFLGVQEGKVESNELLAFEGTGNVESLSQVAKNYIGL